MDGRGLWVPVTHDEHDVPTVGGVWLGDRSEPLPEELETVDYRFERYVRVEDEFVHETLLE